MCLGLTALVFLITEVLVCINTSSHITQRITSWSVHTVLGSSHAKIGFHLLALSSPSFLLRAGEGKAHRLNTILLYCDFTGFFLLYFARDIQMSFCSTCSLWWETGLRSSFCIFFLSVFHFTFIIWCVFCFRNLHRPTIYVERHNLSLCRKKVMVSVLVSDEF